MIMDEKSASALATGSADVPAPPAYSDAAGSSGRGQRFMAIALSHTDRIRMFNCPQPIITVLREVVKARWPKGIDVRAAVASSASFSPSDIQSEEATNGAYEITMKGRPWMAAGTDTATSRQLICALLSALHDQGWEVRSYIGDELSSSPYSV